MKKLLILSLLTSLLILGACGKGEFGKNQDNDQTENQQQAVDNPNELSFQVNGETKTSEATTVTLNKKTGQSQNVVSKNYNITMKIPIEFEKVNTQEGNGDFIRGTEKFKDVYCDIDAIWIRDIAGDPSDLIKNPKRAVEFFGEEFARERTRTVTSPESIDLNQYPHLQSIYDFYYISSSEAYESLKPIPASNHYVFAGANEDKVFLIRFSIPQEIADAETIALIEAIASSVTVEFE